jgi:hypothetical protein
LDRGAINKTQEVGGIPHHVESWLDSGLNLKRAVAFRAVDILPEGGLFLVASFFGDLDLFGYCRGVV